MMIRRWSKARLMVSIMNGQRMGGGFFMAPDGVPHDGTFDLCIAGTAGKFRILQLLPTFMNGTQATQPEIKTGQARKVTITALKQSCLRTVTARRFARKGKSSRLRSSHRRLSSLPCYKFTSKQNY